MKIRAILALGAALVTLSGCGNAKEAEAERLGFSSVYEMERVHSKGWHTNAQYTADETERAKRLGFIDMDELHSAEAAGIVDPKAYRKYKANEDAKFEAEEAAREREAKQEALQSTQPAQVSPAANLEATETANLTELSYGELSRQLRAREKECDKSFGKSDGKINERQRACYSKYKLIYTDACYEKDEIAKRDCAGAANLGQCLEIKHPEARQNIFISGCVAL